MPKTVLCGFFCLAASLCPAQEAHPLVSVSFWRVPPAKFQEWKGAVEKAMSPAMDRLVAEGAVLSYGMDANLYHSRQSETHTLWYSVSNYGAIGRVEEALDRLHESSPAAVQSFLAASDYGAHWDLLLRMETGSFRAPKPGALPYRMISSYRVKPGKTPEILAAFRKYYSPAYERLTQEGTILGYGVFTPVLRRSEAADLYVVLESESMEGFDKILSAVRKTMGGIPEGERNLLRSLEAVFFEDQGGADWLLRAAIYKSGAR